MHDTRMQWMSACRGWVPTQAYSSTGCHVRPAQRAHLLQVVILKALKTVDVQHSDTGSTVLVLADGCVDGCHQPVKHLGVQDLGQGVPAATHHDESCTANKRMQDMTDE